MTRRLEKKDPDSGITENAGHGSPKPSVRPWLLTLFLGLIGTDTHRRNTQTSKQEEEFNRGQNEDNTRKNVNKAKLDREFQKQPFLLKYWTPIQFALPLEITLYCIGFFILYAVFKLLEYAFHLIGNFF